MIVTLQSERIRTIVQVAAFVEANEPVELHPLDRDGACAFVARTLTRLDYRALDRPSKAQSARRRRRGTRGAAPPPHGSRNAVDAAERRPAPGSK